ncbi:MAG: alpha/beta fold hydrolase, partial [Burkholderiaceae bacterium]
MPVDLSHDGIRLWPGPMGPIELLVDGSATARRGIAIIAHPQPLLGGSARHKVPHFLARTVADDGWLAIRPNFRGVGGSGGVHDAGVGETDDLVALCEAARAAAPGRPLALIGVSFGAYVCARAARRLADAGVAASRTC